MKKILLTTTLCILASFAMAQTGLTTLFETPEDKNYYRIPALAVTPDGTKIIAVCDYRYGNSNDLGNHKIDLVYKVGTIGSDGSVTWGSKRTLKEGSYADYNYNYYASGYGDPAIVADADGNGVYVVCVNGSVGFGSGKQSQTYFTSPDGLTWTTGTDISSNIDNLTSTNSSRGDFFASGRILQSRVVKTGSYYRLYAPVLCYDGSSRYVYVLYSDDFGATWKVLMPPGAANNKQTYLSDGNNYDESHVEELSDGTLLISMRHGNSNATAESRYFARFDFSNINTGTGTWTTPQLWKHSNTNPCNGEFFRVRCLKNGKPTELLLQSQPTGSRSNLTVFYKEIFSSASVTADSLHLGWKQGLELTSYSSCYCTMDIMPNGKMGILFEEDSDKGGSYDIMFGQYTLSELTKTTGVYSDVDLTPVRATYGNYAAGATDEGKINYQDHSIIFNNVSESFFNTFDATSSNLVLSLAYNATSSEVKDVHVTLVGDFLAQNNTKQGHAILQYGNYKQMFNVVVNKLVSQDDFTVETAKYGETSAVVDHIQKLITFTLDATAFSAFTISNVEAGTYTYSVSGPRVTDCELVEETTAYKKYSITFTKGSVTQTYTLTVTKDGTPNINTFADGTFVWTGATSTDWNTGSNWKVARNGAWEETNVGPGRTSNVVIPSGVATYPVVTGINSCYCANIYMEAGARLGGQHLLNYQNAYVDFRILPNRYVRVTPVLANTYSGDYYTEHQTLNKTAWTTNPFTGSTYQAEEGADKVNRSFNGTYESLYASSSQIASPYGTYESYQSEWGDPYNGLGYKYAPAEGFDLWVDDDINTDGVTFHFPSSNTSYDYYHQGKLNPDVAPAQTPRNTTSKFVYDKSSTTGQGVLEQAFTRTGKNTLPLFARGNLSMAYMNINEFLQANVNAGYITPFIYKHSAVYGERGTEDIIYYNYLTSDNELYIVKSSTTGDQVPSDSDLKNLTNTVTSTDGRYYMKPGEGFRVMAGAVEVTCIEPLLVGSYMEATYRYAPYTGNYASLNNNTNISKYRPSGDIETHYTIATSVVDPHTIRIDNFVGHGSVSATINPDAGTITIKNGTPIRFMYGNAWSNCGGTTSSTINNQYIYGLPLNSTIFTDTAYTGKDFTQSIPIASRANTCDIVLNYTIDANTGEVTINSTNPFYIYSAEAMAATSSYSWKDRSDNSEAFWVYAQNAITSTKGSSTGDEAFILTACEGRYQTRVDVRVDGRSDPTTIPATLAAGSMISDITIQRVAGTYDHVSIEDLYPGGNTALIGVITKGGTTTSPTYTLTIPAAQPVFVADVNDPSTTLVLYNTGSGDNRHADIVLNWDATNKMWKKTQSAAEDWTTTDESGKAVYALGDYSLMFSHLDATPSSTSDGLILGVSDNDSPKSYPNQFQLTQTSQIDYTPDPDTGTGSGTGSTTDANAIMLRFTPNMFEANPNITTEFTADGILKRAAKAQHTVAKSAPVIITATNSKATLTTMISVNSKAHNAYSFYEDAALFDVADTDFSFGTLAGTQLVGVNNIATFDTIPLYISESATLTFSNLANLGDSVGIFDAFTGQTILINDGSTFYADVIQGEEAGRYFLVRARKPGATTGLENIVGWKVVAYSPAQGAIAVNANSVATFEVFNAAGTLCASVEAQANIFRGLPAGAYVVRATKENEQQNMKVIVY